MILRRKSLCFVTVIALVVTLAVLSIRYLQLDERFYYWLRTHDHAEAWQDRSVWLHDYRAVIQARELPDVLDNLSGLSFDHERGQLWGVINGPSELIGISLDGEILSRHLLNGFHDVEGIVVLGEGRLAVVEERQQTLLVITAPLDSGVLTRDASTTFPLEKHSEQNKEYEGLAYDSINDRLYIAKERDPIKLYRIDSFMRRAQQAGSPIVNVTDSLGHGLFVGDLSALHLDSSTGHLLVLSDESKRLIELGESGAIISSLPLVAGSAGLEGDVPQPEGVTRDDQGRIYLVSEPNLFYRFEKVGSETPQSLRSLVAK